MYFNHRLRPPSSSMTAACFIQICNETEDLSADPVTFTSNRVCSVWRNALKPIQQSPKPITATVKHITATALSGTKAKTPSTLSSSAIRQGCIQTFCLGLVSRANDPASHFTILDEALSSLVLCRLRTEEDEDVVVERACQILSRLPRTPPRVDFYNYAAIWNSEEVAKYCNQSTDSHPEWRKLKVVAAVSSTVINLSLQIATWNKHPNFGLARSMQRYVKASGRGQQSSIDAGHLHRNLHCTGVSMEYMAAVSNAVFLLYNGGDVGM